MAINSFKVCPECGHHNPLSFIECEKCEADLQGVKVTLIDDSKANNQVKKEDVVTKKEVRLTSSYAKENLSVDDVRKKA